MAILKVFLLCACFATIFSLNDGRLVQPRIDQFLFNPEDIANEVNNMESELKAQIVRQKREPQVTVWTTSDNGQNQVDINGGADRRGDRTDYHGGFNFIHRF